ncbi:hypothetical protein SAMN05660642_01609 [Geodermatophilus siccatus]|uniref:Uncharacterized protein n=1 Tax=Geodermatophilus siccatus TaxID=1137991 RepID=A0A1G9QCF2_9ACTN|nr:hypothetical protein [Geodermatophilus siccatus]SDM08742.1 hypothetical protein SAMN05660642_01609 [Geodermatophilus siccatus]
MLALTPRPLQTAGERALFAELARWDTGGAVRGAVVASLPVLDGPVGRRISDAVLFVPEGLAVVRIAEVARQRGVVTALPEGAWTVGPEPGRPGEVLQLSGGGSTPLDGLMRAGMDTAVRLRRAGLEPGRIARLTVLVGDLSGLVPADGDLGEGDQVALLEPRSLLLGIARSARYTGVANPRLWTTADVRAALEALELDGRVPTTQELNGEGFPYSPYVLRTPELLAPAAMAAAVAGAEAGGAAPVPVAHHPAPHAAAPEPMRPLVDPAAAAAVAAAAIRADEEAARAAAPAYARAQDLAVAPVAPPSTAAPDLAAPSAPVVRDTLVGPTVGVREEDTGGLGGLFADAEPRTAQPVAAEPVAAPPAAPPVPVEPPARPPVASGTRPAGVPLVGPRRRQRSPRRTALLVAAALLLVVLLGVGVTAVLGGDEAANAGASPSTAAQGGALGEVAGGPQPGQIETVDGRTFVAQRVQTDPTCVGNAYGTVADFFAATDCAGLARALYSTDVGGRPVVVSVSVADMGEESGALALRALTDRNGSGNVSDLLREGVRYPGGPAQLSGAEYASAVSGSSVTIVETAWAGPGSTGSTADLDVVASTALVLPMPQSTP